MKINIPDDANFILNRLKENGYEGFVVGGCVRDSIIGKTPHDWDICTNAKPEFIKDCFKDYDIFDAGIKHGTISVVINKEVYEITTYRIDGEYSDNRHPDIVEFTDKIEDDLSRRDFTVNAMAYNDDRGLIDPFNGCDDALAGVICCVGNPADRFSEDALRIIRALRFASVYDFSIKRRTADEIHRLRNLLKNIAVERISTELLKLLCGAGAERIIDEFRDVIAVIIPELSVEFDYDQHNIHHNRDLWHHTLCSVINIDAEPAMRMAMLLHDIGKPGCKTEDDFGVYHFYGHPLAGKEIARNILHRLKLSNTFISECLTYIEYHDQRYSGSQRQLKMLLQKIGINTLTNLFKVQRADTLAQSDYTRQDKLRLIDQAESDLKVILDEKACFSLSQLAVNGRDIIACGVTDGRKIGEILNTLLGLVIDDTLNNDYETLINAVKEML